ncbi:MAG: MarR family EPS-associated transcriptional regulator [Gammaproteobacteria bacterium]|nr:MarR family EPS-associated transcriptional regulator [Gammaproteobacteria bacterium]
MATLLTDCLSYRLLSLPESDPGMSQRDLADKLDRTLGKTNYCLRALIDRDWIKSHNFLNSCDRRAYLYKLTLAGARDRANVTRRYLELKLKECAEIKRQIERLRSELRSQEKSLPDRLSGN